MATQALGARDGCYGNDQDRASAREWFHDEMLAMATSLRFQSWRAVEKVVKDMLWVEEVFRVRADVIWEELAKSLPDPDQGLSGAD